MRRGLDHRPFQGPGSLGMVASIERCRVPGEDVALAVPIVLFLAGLAGAIAAAQLAVGVPGPRSADLAPLKASSPTPSRPADAPTGATAPTVPKASGQVSKSQRPASHSAGQIDRTAARKGATPPAARSSDAAAKDQDCHPRLAITFAEGAVSLDPARLTAAKAAVARLARWLVQHPERKVVMQGHADARGDEAENLRLSFRRAVIARRLLVAAGVSPTRITPRGMGIYQPLPGHDPKAAENRRVEAAIVGLTACAGKAANPAPEGKMP